MMKGKELNRMGIRILGIMISCLLLLCSFSLAEEASGLPASDEAETEWVRVAVEDNSGLSEEELAAGYINQILFPGRKTIKKAPKPQGQNLSGANLNMYTKLREKVADIANATLTSTELSFPFEDIYPQLSFAAADLGVASILTQTGELADGVEQALADYRATLQMDAVLNSLMADCPYELYWYDKTAGTQTQYGHGFSVSGDGLTITMRGTFFITMTVSRNYALSTDNGDLDLYQVDPKYGQGVQAAAANAQEIVDQYEGQDNYERLLAYKDEICNLVSYNYDAAYGDDVPYGDPWQMIWVFDGDDSTNVVCEGYAKAFKYLNDLSAGSATVICAEGYMDSGRHMWNIVTIDGRNYLVDVTNCDDGTIGYPEELFMVGSDDGDFINGYYFTANGEAILYAYDHNNSIYSDNQLTISDVDYLDYTGGHEGDDNHLVVLPEEGSNSNTKSIYAAVGDTITMQPYVTADDMTGISYQWYSYNVDRTTGTHTDVQIIEGATESSYTVENYTGTGNYRCQVSDQYGNTETAYYLLYVDNHLTATVDGTNNSSVRYTIEPGESRNLKVQVTADDMSDIIYQWYRNDYNAENNTWNTTKLEGETGDSYTAENITSRVEFSCEVTDRYGSKKYVYFIFNINTDLYINTDGETTRMVNIGDTEQLAVIVSCSTGDIHIQWYKNGTPIEGETGTEITTEAITGDTVYRARAADDYGNSTWIDFRLLILPSVSDMPFIGLDTQTTAEISSQGKMVYFRFVPDETYEYVLYSVSDNDTYGYLYDGNMNMLKSDDDGGENTNFRLSYILQAGNTYVFAVRFFSTDSTGSFPVILTKRVDNHLRAWAEGDDGNTNKEISAVLGERLELKVSVSADDMSNLTYRWDKEYSEGGGSWNGATLTTDGEASWTVENTARTETYICTVTDQYGNSVQVMFYVHIENHLSASVYGEEGNTYTSIPVSLGDNVEMKVAVTADDLSGITYSWLREYYNENGGYWNRTTLADDAGDSWTAENIQQTERYICAVSDRFGNTSEVEFYLRIENHLNAQVDGNTFRFINSGEDTELSVTASCDTGEILYQWFRDDSRISGATGTSISLTNITANARYRCEMRDQYNNNLSISFQVFIKPDLTGIPTISPDTAMTAVVVNGPTYFKFMPAESGRYVFTSDAGDDTYGYLFDGNLNLLASDDDGGNNLNFRIEYTLQGGQAYYYAARFYDMNRTGSFPVLLTMEGTVDPGNPCGEDCTWTLQDGVLTITGSGEMYDYATGNRPPWRWEADTVQAGAVIGVDNIGSQTFWFCTNMTDVYIDTSVTRIGEDAFHGCTSLTNVYYDGTPEMWEAIEIEAGNTSLKMAYYGLHNILTLPAGLQVIESEAFAELTNADAIRIPASVTDIAEDAFNGTSAVILAPAGSYAAQWAADRGLEVIEE